MVKIGVPSKLRRASSSTEDSLLGPRGDHASSTSRSEPTSSSTSTNAPDLVTVQVPSGAVPGQELKVRLPGGQSVVVTLPPNCQPGGLLQLSIQAQKRIAVRLPPEAGEPADGYWFVCEVQIVHAQPFTGGDAAATPIALRFSRLSRTCGSAFGNSPKIRW